MSDKSPSEQLRNICTALAEDLDNSPFTREEWGKLDADRLQLIAANYAFASENERLRGLLGLVNKQLSILNDPKKISNQEIVLVALAKLLGTAEEIDKYLSNTDLNAVKADSVLHRKLRAAINTVTGNKRCP